LDLTFGTEKKGNEEKNKWNENEKREKKIEENREKQEQQKYTHPIPGPNTDNATTKTFLIVNTISQ
jgi:hypothetical protein